VAEDDEADAYEDLPDEDDVDEDVDELAGEDPNAGKRFWFEHATGAARPSPPWASWTPTARAASSSSPTAATSWTSSSASCATAATASARASRCSGSEHNDRMSKGGGPVTVETYQWFVRNAGRISPSYTVVICDEAHTALGEKTSAAIREWTGPSSSA
jgi:hypothetical protein